MTPLQQAAQQALHQMVVNNWNWGSIASDDTKRSVYVELQKALADEQAQAAFAGPEKWSSEEIKAGHIGIRWIGKRGVYGRPTQHDVRKYLETRGDDAKCSCDDCKDEQAQAVEPVVIYQGLGNFRFTGLADVIPAGTELFTHPAPPPAGERAKVGDSHFESWYSELQQAGKGSKQIAREAYEAGMNEAQPKRVTCQIYGHVVGACVECNTHIEAQQVAVPVPVPMTDDQIADWFASENGLEDCNMCLFADFEKVVRATEAHRKIGAKTMKPYGWMIDGVSTVMRGSLAQEIQEQKAKRIGGTCKAFAVYRDAPPVTKPDSSEKTDWSAA